MADPQDPPHSEAGGEGGQEDRKSTRQESIHKEGGREKGPGQASGR
jgi:hypothetical protein